ALGAWVAAAIAAAGCKTTHGDAEGTGGSGVVADGGAGGQPGGTGGAPTGAGGAPTGAGGVRTGAGGSGVSGVGGGAAAGAAGDPCATAIFCDDFEKYAAGATPTSPWRAATNQGAVAVDTNQHRSGTKSVKLTTQAHDGAKTAFIELTGSAVFPVSGNVFHGRMMFLLEAAPTTSVHWTFIQGAGVVPVGGYHALYRYGGQMPIMQGATFVGSQLMANYDTPDSYSGTPPQSDCWQHANRVVVPVGRWACAEWKFDGATNQMSFSLDGAAIPSLNMTGVGQGCVHPSDGPFTWTAPTFDRLSLGWESYQTDGVRTIYIDDVVVSRAPIGCPPP
ncbi:MAG TPA: hypothetical protein VFH68_13275, partial [Polyangia bacterium]|nr:hypothetical protein [Polyangia bacterium]